MNANNFEERLKGCSFHPVVPFDAGKDSILLMDFTENNQDLTLEVLCDTSLFSEYINRLLKGANAAYGIGGYNEHRTIYRRSHVFDAKPTSPNPSQGGAVLPHNSSLDGEFVTKTNPQQIGPGAVAAPSTSERAGGEAEPRRLHLGVDIWGPVGTPVYAPLEGTVHSFAFNDAFGDYGATLILQHDVEGFIFHTLYGHLSLHSIEDKREGQDIAKGDWIAAFGEPAENGQWPPHLHFQIVIDMKGAKGDYPGVCRFSEREKYLANGPDPDLVLGMVQHANNKNSPPV